MAALPVAHCPLITTLGEKHKPLNRNSAVSCFERREIGSSHISVWLVSAPCTVWTTRPLWWSLEIKQQSCGDRFVSVSFQAKRSFRPGIPQSLLEPSGSIGLGVNVKLKWCCQMLRISPRLQQTNSNLFTNGRKGGLVKWFAQISNPKSRRSVLKSCSFQMVGMWLDQSAFPEEEEERRQLQVGYSCDNSKNLQIQSICSFCFGRGIFPTAKIKHSRGLYKNKILHININVVNNAMHNQSTN